MNNRESPQTFAQPDQTLHQNLAAQIALILDLHQIKIPELADFLPKKSDTRSEIDSAHPENIHVIHSREFGVLPSIDRRAHPTATVLMHFDAPKNVLTVYPPAHEISSAELDALMKRAMQQQLYAIQS